MGLDKYLTTQAQKKTQTPDTEYSAFIDLLSQSTFQKQAKDVEPKVSWWKKIVSVLSTGETGHAAYQFLEGKNPVEEYGKDVIRSIQGQGFERKTYADVLEKIGFSTTKLSEIFPDLYTDDGKGVFKFKKGGFLDWSANGTTGLAFDILLDPKTYMGGLGLFTRIGTKGKGLTDVGKAVLEGTDTRIAKIYEQVGKSITEEEAIKQAQNISKRMISKFDTNPDKYYSGITLLGQNVLPRKVALAPGRFLDHTMQSVPILGTVYTGAKAGIQDAFKYGADVINKGKAISEVGEETAQKYIAMKQQMYKRSREISDNIFNDVNTALKDFKKGVPKEQREATLDYIRNKIETNLSDFHIEGVDRKLVDNLVSIAEKHNNTFYRSEAEAIAGLNKDMYSELSSYLPHLISEEGRKALKQKAASKFLSRGYSEFTTQPEKARTWYKFINTENGDELLGSAQKLNLQPYNKATEEAFLTKQANRLIQTQKDRIKRIERTINQLNIKQLKTALKTGNIKLEQKVAKLKTVPVGTKTIRKIGKTKTGLSLYRESITKKPKYTLRTAELKNNETLKFIENIINLPKKEVEKIQKLIDTQERGLGRVIDEIFKIKDDLNAKINSLPDTEKWYKSADGKIFRTARHASIDEVNKALQPLMNEAGFNNKSFFMTDPFEIIYNRGQKSAKNIAAAEYYKGIVNQFGKKGEGVEKFIRNATTRKTRKEIVYNEFVDEATGIRYVDPKITTLPEGTMLPDFIVQDMKKVKEFVDDEQVGNQLLKFYDKILLEWKGSVYGWYPASHGRNLIGGTFNNWLAGLVPGDRRYALTRKIINGDTGTITTKNGIKISYQEIKKQLSKLGVLGQTGYLDVNEMRKAFNPSVFKKAKEVPMKAMEMVENNLRIPLFVKGLEDTGSFEEAAKLVFKYHFDYAPEALSTFERNVMKRIIPFYRWTRGNIPLMMEEFIAQPGKMTGLFKSLREMQDEEGNIMQDLLPSYIEKEFAISRGGQTITGTGLPPIEMLKLMREPTRTFESGLTPFLKIPLELRTNYSLFKDMAVTEDVSGNFAEKYPEPLKKWLQYEEKVVNKKDGTSYTIKRVDPMRKYWLYALPTARIASLATTVMGEKETNKLLNAISGLRTYEYDMQQLRDNQQRIYEKKLIEIFTNAGLFGQINYPFADTKEKAGN